MAAPRTPWPPEVLWADYLFVGGFYRGLIGASLLAFRLRPGPCVNPNVGFADFGGWGENFGAFLLLGLAKFPKEGKYGSTF